MLRLIGQYPMRFYFSKQGVCTTTSDEKCQFPFKYNGDKYYSCVDDVDPWCAISVKGNGEVDVKGECDMTKCRQTGNLDI